MAEPANRSPNPRGGFRRAGRWWAVTGTFLGGLVVGVVLAGLLSSGAQLPTSPGGGADAPARTDETPPTAAEATPAGATGELVVNDACLRAINAAQDMFDVVQDLGEALAGFNAARLDEIVRRLQPLQRRLDENSDDCEVQGRVPTGSQPSGAGSPSPSTSGASPTD